MLVLATRLRTLDRSMLVDGLRRRRFESAGVRDAFDLAEALLAPDSVADALSRLDRSRLAVLAAAAELGDTTSDAVARQLARSGVDAELEALSARFLLIVDGEQVISLDAVAAQLDDWPDKGLPSAAELASPPPPRSVVSPDPGDIARVDALAAERAFRTVSALAEVVASIAQEPARELGKGGLSLPDARRLAAAARVDVDEVPGLLALAVDSGLVRRDSAEWLETPEGESWMALQTPERWRLLASRWRETLPAELLAVLADRAGVSWGAPLRDDVHWFYPAGGDWLDGRIAAVERSAEALGLTARGAVSGVGARVLVDDLDAAVPVLAALLPHQVDKVYIQHDLTLVSPGPLVPALDARLRTMADVEGRELASTWRVSLASVNRALALGETAESLLAFLSGLSLTGMPQPLTYLVTETAARYGSVRAGALGTDEFPDRSYVRSDDEALIGTIAVDQSLASIGLRRSGPHRLVSRLSPDIVFWALSDARYPVAAEDADGAIVQVRRTRVARQAPVVEGRDPVAELVDRLAARADDLETDAAWLVRQLEAAAKAKQPLTVSVRMPGGGVADYLLEPTSVANGRVRARDRRADIERTLPLSAIAGITAAAE